MPSQPKRLPGEKNPGPDTRDVDQLANTAPSHGSATQAGAGDGVSGELLGLWANFRRGRAKKRAMAAHEARRHQDGQRE
jgi:hypothetical protein